MISSESALDWPLSARPALLPPRPRLSGLDMAFYVPPLHLQPRRTASTTSLPQRSDSLRSERATPKTETLSLGKVLSATDDDLRDARRVSSHGQEEDLKYALNKLIGRVEELVSRRDLVDFVDGMVSPTTSSSHSCNDPFRLANSISHWKIADLSLRPFSLAS